MYPKRSYELFFIEQDQKTGDFFRVREHIQDGEKERTKKLIQAVMQKIETLSFPDTSSYPQSYEGIRQFEEDLLE